MSHLQEEFGTKEHFWKSGFDEVKNFDRRNQPTSRIGAMVWGRPHYNALCELRVLCACYKDKVEIAFHPNGPPR
jgi:hypothetical protein